MTIDLFACYERDVHVKPNKSFYPANIPNAHNQLRHLICSPSDNRIYYVDGRDVWCLDPAQSRRTHITELSFDPSCTAAAHGWFCAGGLHGGHFAYIQLPNPEAANSLAYLNNFFGTRTHSDNSPSSFHVNHLQLGAAIINSVSIHRLPRLHPDSEEDEEVVAVVTNNDCTVRVFSLSKHTELTRIRFEYAMNHASISPDGNTMLIVGDKEFAFVYQRIPVPKAAESGAARLSSFDWAKIQELTLYKPRKPKSSGYFTTAWSNSGTLCATASELGYVTVMDAAALRVPDSNPVMAIVPSSRPQTTPGAIRSMCFAPDQFDLLLWTENYGRICVADLRSGLRARQVVVLDAKAEDVTQIDALKVTRSMIDPELRDLDLDIDMIRRQQRTTSDEDTARDVSFASEYLAASAERRRLQRENGVPDVGDELSGLTEQERQVIDGIRTSRQQEARYLESRYPEYRLQDSRLREQESSELEQASTSSNRRSSPQSINYSTPVRRRRQWESLLDATDELGQEHSTLSSIRDYLWASRLDESSRIDALSALAQHRIRSRLDASPSASSSRPSSSSNLANTVSAASSTDPWRTIEAAMRAATPSGSANPASTSNPSATRIRSQDVHDSDNESGADPRFAQPPASNQSTSSRTSTRATLPNLRGNSSAYLDSERRRIQNEMSSTASELTTRGQVLYARQRERERLRSGDHNDEPGAQDSASGLARFDTGILRRMAAGTRPVIGEPGFIAREGLSRRNIPTETDGIDDSNEPEDGWGVGTAGICFGDNGRVVYVGTDDGIFGLRVNLRERQFWPAITPR